MASNEFNLQKFVISVVIVGISLVIGIYITSSLGTTFMDTDYPVSVLNETLSANITQASQTVSGATSLNFAAFTVSQLLVKNNSNSWVVVPSTNYTVVSTGTISLISNPKAEYNNTNAKVTYSYTFTNSTSSSTAADNVTNALATGTSWISILVVVGFATIILSLLTSGLGTVAREQGAVPYY